MGLRVSFDLDDNDLRHFQLIMRESRKAAASKTQEAILAGAEELLKAVGTVNVPQFVRERRDNLELMIRMLSDREWRLPAQEAARVYNALAYFCEAEDLIPDQIPGLGFLDDAIMIELVVRELRHELDAYRDFCDFRARHAAAGDGKAAELGREEWLENRRRELQSRMRRRKKRNGAQGGKRPLRLL